MKKGMCILPLIVENSLSLFYNTNNESRSNNDDGTVTCSHCKKINLAVLIVINSYRRRSYEREII